MTAGLRVYVATGLPNRALAQQVIAALTEQQIEVTYDWTTHGDVGAEPPERRAQVAAMEVEGVTGADVLLILPGGRLGTHVEIGIALGLGIPVIQLEPPGSVVFHHHPRISHRSCELEPGAIVRELRAAYDELFEAGRHIRNIDILLAEREMYAARLADLTWSHVCEMCGCTENDACEGGCWWVSKDPPICSACGDMWDLVVARYGEPQTPDDTRRLWHLARLSS